MGQVLITKSILTAIANAIRGKNGSSDTYKPGEMAEAISDIPSGTPPVLITKTITANNTYSAEDDDADGYSAVTVAVPGPSGTKQISINTNGTTTHDVSAYASAEITVAVPGGASLVSPFKVATGSITPASNTTTLYIDIDSSKVNLSTDTIMYFWLIMDESEWSDYEGDADYDNKVAGVIRVYFKPYYETNANNPGGVTQTFLSTNANYHSYKSNNTVSITEGQNQLTVKPYSQSGLTFIGGATYKYILVATEARST